MAKLPNLSDLTKKLDVQKMVKDFRALISPGHSTPEAPEGNEMAEKIAELIGVVNQLADTHAEQAKEIARVNSQLHELYKYVVSEQETAEKSNTEAKAGAEHQATSSPETQQSTAHTHDISEDEKQHQPQGQKSQSRTQHSDAEATESQASSDQSQSIQKQEGQEQKTAQQDPKDTGDDHSSNSANTDKQ